MPAQQGGDMLPRLNVHDTVLLVVLLGAAIGSGWMMSTALGLGFS